VKLAISQPTYLPWLGYFDLIDQVDGFVFLDNVQFEKRSWQQRNRIKGPHGLILLTVPVTVSGRFHQTVADAVISDVVHQEKHRRSVEMNYRRSLFFDAYWPSFSSTLQAGWESGRLVELNILLIKWCMRQLGIEKRLWRATDLPCEGRRGELLAKICQYLDANEYLSVPGSAAYLVNEEHEFSSRGIRVFFQRFEHPEYNQLFPPFLPYASAIDLIFNHGTSAIEILRSGRRSSIPIADISQTLAEKAKA